MTQRVMNGMLGLLASLLLAGTAWAADTSEQFNALDTNQDGVLSVEEAQQDATLNEVWADVDTDQNGSIDPVEFSAFEAMSQEEMPAESTE